MANNLDLSKFPKVRNRDDVRALKKVLRRSGKTKEEADKIIDLTKVMTKAFDNEPQFRTKECLFEGDKVKLNIDKILAYPDWESRQEQYRDFVMDNVDTVFTVQYDEKYQSKPAVVKLLEDKSEQQWLFSDVDLLVLDESDGGFKEIWMIESAVNKN